MVHGFVHDGAEDLHARFPEVDGRYREVRLRLLYALLQRDFNGRQCTWVGLKHAAGASVTQAI